MENITSLFQQAYLPKQAIVIFEQSGGDGDYYVESYDMDGQGRPINAHPLSPTEAIALAKALDSEQQRNRAFLRPNGLLPQNVLYINPSQSGFVVWHTPPGQKQLFFKQSLGIPNGMAKVPHLLWIASKEKLHLFALKAQGRPAVDEPIYHAPFFNLYDDGAVCMGTVDVDIKNNSSLEDFMACWENYFFNSYFSHLIEGHNPVNGNAVQLWEQQVTTENSFPLKALIKTRLTLKKIISWNF